MRRRGEYGAVLGEAVFVIVLLAMAAAMQEAIRRWNGILEKLQEKRERYDGEALDAR